jgi:chromosome segregation ATPase
MALKKGRLAKVDAELQAAARRIQDLDNPGNSKNDPKEVEAKRFQNEIKDIENQLNKKSQEGLSIKQLADKLTEKIDEHKDILESLREKQEEYTRALSKYRKFEVTFFVMK